MTTVATPGGGARDGFPGDLYGPSDNGSVDNGKPLASKQVEELERAVLQHAARRKYSIPAIRADITRTYSAGDLSGPLAYIAKEMYSQSVQAFGFFSTTAVTSTDQSDVRAYIGINSTEDATYTETPLPCASFDASELIYFQIPAHEIGAGDAADHEHHAIGIRLRWDNGAGSDVFTLHSITLLVEPMDEIDV